MLRKISVLLMLFMLSCTNRDFKLYNTSSLKTSQNIYQRYAVSGPTKFSNDLGKQVLANGGNAMDAALTMQAALSLSEMQASGIGGGGYILYFHKKSGKIYSFDGKETSPRKANRKNVFGSDVAEETKYRSEFGVQYIATPGMLKAMKVAHDKFGSIKWQSIFEPTILAAKNGIKVEKRFSLIYKRHEIEIPDVQRHVSVSNGVLKVPSLSSVLEEVSLPGGVDSFYKGDLADRIVRKVKRDGGVLEKIDLESYQARMKDASCINYKDFKICTRNNNYHVLTALKLMETADLSGISHSNDPKFINLVVNSVNAAIANKRKYDQDGFNDYAKVLDVLDYDISSPGVSKAVKLPNGKKSNKDNGSSGTTSFFAIDQEGNIAIFCTSINGYFGSGIVAEGIVMNNTMLDFSDCVNCNNEIRPGARPSSNISQIIVLDKKNRPLFGVSSAGGIRIMSYVTSVLVSMMDLGMNPQEAINSFKYSAHNNGVMMVEPRFSKKTIKELEKIGHSVKVSDEVISGLVAFKISDKGIMTGSEPRRWGSSDGL